MFGFRVSVFLFVFFVSGILISGPAHGQVYENSFDVPNANDWINARGTWNVSAGALLGRGGRFDPDCPRNDGWAWVGDPPITLPDDFSLRFGVEFLSPPAGRLLDGVGRHGGIMFCATTPTHHRDPRISGYQLYWIDREGDHGFNLFRIDNGIATCIAGSECGVGGGGDLLDPPLEWKVVVDSRIIYFWGDDELLLTVDDATYRGGHLGLFVWGNNQIAYDDFLINEGGLPGCGTCEPEVIEIGQVYDHQLDCLANPIGAPIRVPTRIYSLEVEDLFEGIISVSSDDFDPSLSFYNDFCDEVARNNVCRITEADACLNVNLGPGIYTIGVRSQDPEIAGNFSISVSRTEEVETFSRGDANADSRVDISDAIFVLNFLFLGSGTPFCSDAADINDDGTLDLSDAISILNRLFFGGREIPLPGLFDCGADPTEDSLDCERFSSCEI